jgi:hypothetical protein
MRNEPFMLRDKYIAIIGLLVPIVIIRLYHNSIVDILHVPAAVFQIALQWSMIVLFVGREAFSVLTISHVELNVPVHRRSCKYWKAWVEREGVVVGISRPVGRRDWGSRNAISLRRANIGHPSATERFSGLLYVGEGPQRRAIV